MYSFFVWDSCLMYVRCELSNHYVALAIHHSRWPHNRLHQQWALRCLLTWHEINGAKSFVPVGVILTFHHILGGSGFQIRIAPLQNPLEISVGRRLPPSSGEGEVNRRRRRHCPIQVPCLPSSF